MQSIMKSPLFILTLPLLASLAAQPVTAQGAAKAKRVPARARQAANPASEPPQPTLANVPYGKHERHILDFWRAESDTPTPLVFVVHGGGWLGGEKERVNRFVNVQELLKAGIRLLSGPSARS
jgi:acetyl esterase/lipase